MAIRAVLTLCLLIQPMLGWWCQAAAVPTSPAVASCCTLAEGVGREESRCPAMPRGTSCPSGVPTRSCCPDVPRMAGPAVRIDERVERVEPAAPSRAWWSGLVARPVETRSRFGGGHAAMGVKDLRARLCVRVI